MRRQNADKGMGWLLPLLILTCQLLTACASSPKANFYTLAAGQSQEQLCSADQAWQLKIDLLHFPELLAQPQIATRPQPNRIEYAEFHRWAAPLESDFQQILAANLQQRCRHLQVIPESWPGGSTATYQLSLDVRRFDGRRGESATLSVQWMIRGEHQEVALARRQSDFIEPVSEPSYAALVAAQSRTVASLAREILQACPRRE